MTTRPPRKTAAKKATAVPSTPTARRAPQDRRPKATVSTLVDGPVEAINFDAEPAAVDEATVHLFTLNETDYYVPATPRANVALQLMTRYRVDPVAAQGWLLEELLGQEAYDALAAWDGLRPEHLQQLIAAVTKLTMGSVEDATRPLGRG